MAKAARPGKGLDVGTANLVCAREDAAGSVAVSSIRNAFLDVPADPFTRSMLSRLKVQCVQREDKLYIVGETAFELANVFNRETRRSDAGDKLEKIRQRLTDSRAKNPKKEA